MRPSASMARHLEQRTYLLAARWIAGAAHALVARHILGLAAGRLALRLSSALSRRAWRLWRAEWLDRRT